MTTTLDLCLAQLAAIAPHTDQSHDAGRLGALLGELAPRLGVADVDDRPRWSALTDDCTPFELSVAVAGGPARVRVLLEAQADPASPSSYWESGRRLTADLAAAVGSDTATADAVADLFEPTDPMALWGTWQSVELVDDAPARVRVLFNPAASGRGNAPRLLDETIRRLGLPDLRATVVGRIGDLSWWPVVATVALGRATPRLGLHLTLDRPSAADLERVAALSPHHHPGDAADLLRLMTGTDRADRRTLFATLHIEPDGIGAVNVAVPCVPYCADDAEARDRIAAVVGHLGLDPSRTLALGEAVAPDPDDLAGSEGIHSFVTVARLPDGPRVSVAYALRAFQPRHGWIAATDPAQVWPSPIA